MNKASILEALKTNKLWQEIDRRTGAIPDGERGPFLHAVTELLEELRAEGKVEFSDSPLIHGYKTPPFAIKLKASASAGILTRLWAFLRPKTQAGGRSHNADLDGHAVATANFSESVPNILKCSNIAPMLVEVPAKSMRPLAQKLAEAWTPSLIVEDSSPDFQQQLETAVTAGICVVFVVHDAESISGFIEGVRYAQQGITQMVSIDKRFVEVHEAFRLCLVLKQGVSTWADPWRERMRDHWLYRKIG